MIGHNLKKESFGQIQIIAKTLLIVSGIFIIDRALLDFIRLIPSFFYMSEKPSYANLLFFGISFIFFLSIVAIYMIFNNNRLVKKILSAEDLLPAEYEKLWFISSLRIGLVFCGLFFFVGSASVMFPIIKTIVSLPFLGRQFFSDIIYRGGIPKIRDLSHFYINLYNFFKLVLSIYLLAGAPGFIKWQMKRTLELSESKGAKYE